MRSGKGGIRSGWCNQSSNNN